ncbi:MAG TPA: UDP-N-acetylmuramoyl-tripeptide--D-alanyl-D-alanine ligase, partial [Phnomibacter sp.]|nr:UDP-N-acetylmuramoyl-tripeptide--D-alanyl-D-alanine ligase [Phnomibacter sp.]
HYLDHPGICIDSRKIKQGDIFFALKGENVDGNKFAQMAIDAGASLSVVDDPSLPPHAKMLLVPDVLQAMQQLASHHRSKLNIPVIAITGSNGKTTTKELMHAVLSRKFRTSTTQGNLNNHIGIPITLLRIPKDAEMAVVEMGANHQKEIEGYCAYTRPTHGMITNCGKAHLEGFGGVEGVRKGKGELFDFLGKASGTVFVCSDFDYFHRMVKERSLEKIIWYGTDNTSGISGKVIEAEPFLKVWIQKGFEKAFLIETQLVGAYNIYNVLAAVTIGRQFGVGAEDIQQAIKAFAPDNSRSQLMQKDGNTIVLDAYNANPTSMAAAIINFAGMKADKKVLILGGMAELGDESLEEHQAIVELIGQYHWDDVTLVGGDFGKIAHSYRFFPSSNEARAWFLQQGRTGVTLLLKGSRSMAMEKVVGL